MHVVRPDRFFSDHAAAFATRTVATSLDADGTVYDRNQHLKLPRQSKKEKKAIYTRVQKLITWVFMDHIVTTAFDPDSAELTLAILVPPAIEPAAKKAKTNAPGTQPPITIAPWPVPSESVPEHLAMTAPPLETLALVRHSMERTTPATLGT